MTYFIRAQHTRGQIHLQAKTSVPSRLHAKHDRRDPFKINKRILTGRFASNDVELSLDPDLKGLWKISLEANIAGL